MLENLSRAWPASDETSRLDRVAFDNNRCPWEATKTSTVNFFLNKTHLVCLTFSKKKTIKNKFDSIFVCFIFNFVLRKNKINFQLVFKLKFCAFIQKKDSCEQKPQSFNKRRKIFFWPPHKVCKNKRRRMYWKIKFKDARQTQLFSHRKLRKLLNCRFSVEFILCT